MSATLCPFRLAHCLPRRTEGSRRYLDRCQDRGTHRPGFLRPGFLPEKPLRFWDGRALAVDGAAARGTRGALPQERWSAGTPPRAWPLLPAACLAHPDATLRTLPQAHTAGYGGARPTPAAALLLSPSASRPRDRETMRACEAPGPQRTAAASRPAAARAAAHNAALITASATWSR